MTGDSLSFASLRQLAHTLSQPCVIPAEEPTYGTKFIVGFAFALHVTRRA
jgi:hypothetical protein